MSEISQLVAQLAAEDENQRHGAFVELYRRGADQAQAAVRNWAADADLRGLVSGPPTVGIAVHPARFAEIRTAWGEPPLAAVPAEQDAREFALQVEFDGALALLDILTARDAADPGFQGERGAIARFLRKFGEGIQQVEFPCKDVARAAEILRVRFALEPVYAEPRPGADGTRVNFFLVPVPGSGKVLVELFERAPRSSD
ncbi:MAG: hypothetical protein ACRD5G_04405 [Candidatus Acidiferrales bacterium]